MPNKKKLNSKNPKYMDKSQLKERAIKEKKLICNAFIRDSSKNIVPNRTAPIYGVWYE